MEAYAANIIIFIYTNIYYIKNDCASDQTNDDNNDQQ